LHIISLYSDPIEFGPAARFILCLNLLVPMIWNEKSLHLTKPAEFIWPDLP